MSPRHRRAVSVAVALGVALGLAFAWGVDSAREPPLPSPAGATVPVCSGDECVPPDGSVAPAGRPEAAEPPPEGAPVESRPPSSEDAQLSGALSAGVRRAAAAWGGSVEAAVMLDGWSEPAVRTSTGAAPTSNRIWSMSKVVTALALLRRDENALADAAVAEAVTGALVRSENCRQRRVVLALQDATGGPLGARRAVSEVLRIAGADSSGVARASEAPATPECAAHIGPARADERAVQFGTAEWQVGDAARVMYALGSGAYGAAASEQILPLLRRPKEPSGEAEDDQQTRDPAWGAGRALSADWAVAYKAGWGGSQGDADRYSIGQMAYFEAGGRRIALAVSFRPDTQPPTDNPDLTPGPAAVEKVMRTFASALE